MAQRNGDGVDLKAIGPPFNLMNNVTRVATKRLKIFFLKHVVHVLVVIVT